jgi:hypothetical protein
MEFFFFFFFFFRLESEGIWQFEILEAQNSEFFFFFFLVFFFFFFFDQQLAFVNNKNKIFEITKRWETKTIV